MNQITQFALGDDEIDYSLWNPDHPLGTDYYGTIIENMPITEAIPDEMWVNAFVAGAPQNTWVSVLTPETYTADWTDDTVIAAVTLWAQTTFPPASGRP